MDNQAVIEETPGQPGPSSNNPSVQQPCCNQRPPLERKKSSAYVYTPHQEDKLCRRLKFFFMGPHEKIKAKRRCPWKLMIQILKIILVTAQLIQFGFSRSRFVEYTEKLTVSLKHLYLQDWNNAYETMPYPPAIGVYALYHVDTLIDHINFAMRGYNETEKNTIGSLKFVVQNKTHKVPDMMRMCRKYYKKGKIYDNGTYDIDAEITEKCQKVSGFYNASGDWTYDIRTYLKKMYNDTIEMDSTVLGQGNINAVGCTSKFGTNASNDIVPSELLWNKTPFRIFGIGYIDKVTFDDSNKDGQMLVDLITELEEKTCKGNYSNHEEETEARNGSYALDSIVIIITVFSMLLCSRSIVRAQLLRLKDIILAGPNSSFKKTVKFFKHRYGKSLSFSDQLEFLNLWYVTIIINDVLTIVGSGYKIQIEGRSLKSSSSTYDVCGVMLGTGSLLAWLGVLRYIGFFEQFNILILTLKKAFPSMLRFLACCLMLYIGFVICGWVVLGPYHIKFRHLSTASECLFSLINGDDMFVTFSATMTDNELVWYYSRIYLYTFNSLFIYAVLNLFLAVINETYICIKENKTEYFPKSELFKFIDQCTDPAHSSIYRKDDHRRIDSLFSLCCCCGKKDPDQPNEYTSLIT